MEKINRAVLSIGTNLGDKKENIRRAIMLLSGKDEIISADCSPLYKTKPVGKTDQDDFYNCCVLCQTTADPFRTLAVCHEIENEMGRVRIERWGPRVIDLDIVFFENIMMNTEKLTLPHPAYKTRGFVLKPLSDLFPALCFAGFDFSEYFKSADMRGVTLVE